MGALKYIADKLFSNDKEVALLEDVAGVESGSNSNGSWTKISDGTIMQWNRILVSTQTGVAVTTTVTFPVKFVGKPSVGTPNLGTSTPQEYSCSANVGVNNDVMNVYVHTTGAGGNRYVEWQAIGRWK